LLSVLFAIVAVLFDLFPFLSFVSSYGVLFYSMVTALLLSLASRRLSF
jgi:hypothetical protein